MTVARLCDTWKRRSLFKFCEPSLLGVHLLLHILFLSCSRVCPECFYSLKNLTCGHLFWVRTERAQLLGYRFLPGPKSRQKRNVKSSRPSLYSKFKLAVILDSREALVQSSGRGELQWGANTGVRSCVFPSPAGQSGDLERAGGSVSTHRTQAMMRKQESALTWGNNKTLRRW